MFRSYLKIAWRNLYKRKFYTFLNISGLALAIGCCTLMYLYISYNLSFDTYHKDAPKIFRLVNEVYFDKTEYDKGAAYAEFRDLKAEVPQIKAAAFSISKQSAIINIDAGGKRRFKEDKTITFTNAVWFKLFTYRWLKGVPSSMDEPGQMVLNERVSHKYFGNDDPVGKTLLYNDQPIKIAGVIADSPYNTDLQSDIYVSFSSLNRLIPEYATDKYFLKSWGDNSSFYNGFVLLNNADDKTAVEKQANLLAEKNLGKDAMKYYNFKLLPLKDIHFDTRYGGTVQRSLLIVLTIIGFLIIAIAVINYINIVIAQQTRRGVEIGTRKVLGGSVQQIFFQFITESLLTAFLSVLVAIIMVWLILPLANNWLFTDAPIYVLNYANLCIYLFIILLLLTIGTGVYPALILSRISIARVLKNNVLKLPVGVGRKVMVIFQNTITQGLIVCTLIMVMQVYFLKNTDLGFNRKMVITIPVGKITASQKVQFGQSLKSIPSVQGFSFCNKPPSSDSQRGGTVQYSSRTQWEKWPARYAIGDSAYCHTFGLHLVAGRNIRDDQPVPEFLINETMANMLEGKNKNNVIGKKLNAGDAKRIIVGIVRDFSVKSLIEPIEPSIVLEEKNLQTSLAVKLSGNNVSSVLSQLQMQYQQILPDQVYTYQFVDEQIALLYKKENIQQKLIWMASVLAIIISSLGLWGLISLTALQRTKEIGIRKILGATVKQITLLLSYDLLAMVLIAFIIAVPASFWIMHTWLQNFAYRISIQWWVFIAAGCFAFVIAGLSIGLQATKAATANPVNSLRSE